MSCILFELNLKRANNAATLLDSNSDVLIENFEFIKSDLLSRCTDSFHD